MYVINNLNERFWLTILEASCPGRLVPLLWAWSMTELDHVRIMWHCLPRGSSEAEIRTPILQQPTSFHQALSSWILSASGDLFHYESINGSMHSLVRTHMIPPHSKSSISEHCPGDHLQHKGIREIFHIQAMMTNVGALSDVSVFRRIYMFYVFFKYKWKERVPVYFGQWFYF